MSTVDENPAVTKFEPRKEPMIGSILITVGWLVFILLYALYWSQGFGLFQNLIVTIVSLATTGLLTGAVWMIWYHTTGEPRRKDKEEMKARNV